MGNMRSIGKKPSLKGKSFNVVSIGSMRITPKQKAKFHRKEAVKSLKVHDFKGYRFHSLQIAKINTDLIISKKKQKV